MPSTKEHKDFILEQLSEIPNLTCRPMMGEFLLYSNGILFGGIYDNRLLVKIVSENSQYNMSTDLPYSGSKPMYLIEDIDDKQFLTKIVKSTMNGLKS
jgi:TfoX/Sxy family transcriptional regulator of competence genes